MTVKKIISGGQTGADQGGLEAGKQLGIETGGTAPLGWKTEDGPMPNTLQEYRLTECLDSDYRIRTGLNILDSDGTVIFGNVDSPGSKLTIRLCEEYKKPFNINPQRLDFKIWLFRKKIQTLNVAGNRESKNPGIQTRVRNFLVDALKERT